MPLELLQEHGSYQPRNDTAVRGFQASSSLPDLCQGVFFVFFLNSSLNGTLEHKTFCLSFLTWLLSEVGLGPLIADFRWIYNVGEKYTAFNPQR